MTLPLKPEDLMGDSWRFWRLDQPDAVKDLTFLADGSITGTKSSNEMRWRLDDGMLSLTTKDGTVTTRFDSVERDDELVRLQGPHVLRPEKKITLMMERGCSPPGFTTNWTRNSFKDMIRRHGWEIGEYSYGAPKILSGEHARLKIGRFCSIATGVIIGIGNHRTDTVTTFPFPTLRRVWSNAPDVPDHVAKGDVEIGSDVWIGINVFITSGVKIGHGAVIGAYSMVTKDIEPYSIVAGNPARHIRHRFEPEIVERLLKLEWWNWDYDRVNAALDHIMSDDITAFLDKAEAGEI